MVMTHLTEVTDRIDRSNSPWGGREERELDFLSKDQKLIALDNAPKRDLLQFNTPIHTAIGVPIVLRMRVLPFRFSGALRPMKTILSIAACALTLASSLSAANVSGKVSFVTKRGQNPVINETLVWLEPVGARAPKMAPGRFQMVTRGKMVVPHVLAIPIGSTVDFPNDDPISHNLFSLSSNNPFDLGLYRRGAGKSQRFENPGLVNVYCNVHPNMSAVIQVMTTPYYAFADPAGNYSLANVPTGRYRLIAWNEQGGQTESLVDVTPSGAVSGNVALMLDSRNYRLTQHMNKVGKPYESPSLKDY